MKQYLPEYLADERNRLILRLMDVLGLYFRKHPDVGKSDLEAFLASLSVESQAVKGDEIFFYDGRLLFRLVEANNEMQDYLERQRSVIFPTRSEPEKRRLMLQMGSGLADILDGQNLLVVFLAFRYQGVIRDINYSTFFLGYSDKNFGQKIQQGRGGAFLAEFQSWLSEECARKPFLVRLLKTVALQGCSSISP